MKQASVTVKYINPPKGKGPASIKDDKGNYWKFWTNKIPMDKFTEGKTYSVGYETEDYQGKEQRTIVAVGMPQEEAPKVSNGHNDPSRDKNIFICGVVNQGIAAGKIDPLSAVDLTLARKAAAEAFEACP